MLLVYKFRLSVTPTGKLKILPLLFQFEFLSFPCFFCFIDSYNFWMEKSHGLSNKCLIRSLKFLCNIASSGPSVFACTPAGMGDLIPHWAAYSIFIQLCKWNCFFNLVGKRKKWFPWFFLPLTLIQALDMRPNKYNFSFMWKAFHRPLIYARVIPTLNSLKNEHNLIFLQCLGDSRNKPILFT